MPWLTLTSTLCFGSACNDGGDEAPELVCPAVSPDCASSCDERGPTLRARFELEAGDGELGLAFFLLVPHSTSASTIRSARGFVEQIAQNTRTALSPCGLSFRTVRAEVWSVRPDALDLEVTRPTSWAGAAPPGEKDADAFNHAQNDQLPLPLAELIDRLRADLEPGVLSVVVAREVAYWSNGVRHTAGGASLPPLVFHQAEDFPERNTVFAATIRSGCEDLPVPPTPRLVAHELGHMLLDTAQHDLDPQNLMHDLRGPVLRPEQCAKMAVNVPRLYGAAPLVDPGPEG